MKKTFSRQSAMVLSEFLVTLIIFSLASSYVSKGLRTGTEGGIQDTTSLEQQLEKQLIPVLTKDLQSCDNRETSSLRLACLHRHEAFEEIRELTTFDEVLGFYDDFSLQFQNLPSALVAVLNKHLDSNADGKLSKSELGYKPSENSALAADLFTLSTEFYSEYFASNFNEAELPIDKPEEVFASIFLASQLQSATQAEARRQERKLRECLSAE
jgi:hypothetical protein